MTTVVSAGNIFLSRTVDFLKWCFFFFILVSILFGIRTNSLAAGIGNALAILTFLWVLGAVVHIAVSLFSKLTTGRWFRSGNDYAFTALSTLVFITVTIVHVAACVAFVLLVHVQFA